MTCRIYTRAKLTLSSIVSVKLYLVSNDSIVIELVTNTLSYYFYFIRHFDANEVTSIALELFTNKSATLDTYIEYTSNGVF